ncbi:pirin family protein [Calothrix sp. NIES-3974]|uniref:pirin family protein n=1 Tax=Calothrix sp. NIES-3974 TaxID=2005462 RepID=UPI000B61D63C|nr:pirin family protein [Calothrix sp. NIES-3974]BAZ07443.1 Pirin-like protein [Calothrix sp. NIES-3974]
MSNPISQLIAPHEQDLGGFVARRILPQEERMMVGPFIFFDHLGPAVFPPGKGVDVRPHPHINLATVTYLFTGGLLHRDSLGTIQEIRPGAVNWMTAGRGISHSERSPESDRQIESTIHGIQTWVALPDEDEETEPWFRHHPPEDIPTWEANNTQIKLIAGKSNGYTSPVKVFSPMLYLDVVFNGDGKYTLAADYSERAVYTVTPGIHINGKAIAQHRLAIINLGEVVEITASTSARCIIIGGEPVGPRQKWWNFVSSRPERIAQAKIDWKNHRFGQVPQETEFIPLPE